MAGTLACSVVAAGRVLLGRLVVVAADTVPVDTALVRTANSLADSDMAYLQGKTAHGTVLVNAGGTFNTRGTPVQMSMPTIN